MEEDSIKERTTEDKTTQMMEREGKSIIQTYTRQPLLLVRGSGAHVWDAKGIKYLDFTAGIAVNSLGHCHPRVVEAIRQQAGELIHTSNIYYTENQILLAEVLTELTEMDKAFFCNSGAESLEAALKLARKATGKSLFVAASGGFHGRTLGALSITHKPAYRKPFGPLYETVFIPYNDVEALKAAVSAETSAVVLEPVQGEGGVNVPAPTYLKAARDICDDSGALLILDEVQTGFGRTGRWFAKEYSGVLPDVMTLAKAIAGGLPMGVMLASDNVSDILVRGDHASTFGGGPLICAAALAAIDVIRRDHLVKRSYELGEYLRSKLRKLKTIEVRGLGLMVGVELENDCPTIVTKARERGVLLNNTSEHVIRMVPPLVIKEKDIDQVVSVLGKILEEP